MSWSMRTWQPPVRRDGPLIVIAAFFLLPGLFFISAWYADYFRSSSSSAVVAIMGAIAVFVPSLLCYQLAGRAGRRRILWALLVLAGSVMSLWLATQYLVIGGSLPAASYIALPAALRRVLATTLVSSVPLLMGMLPVLVYGLAVGQDRPLAGVPPRGAVIFLAVVGGIIWMGTLFLALLNPAPPPLIPLGNRVEVLAQLTRPAGLPGEIVPATWAALFWRLHDGMAPGVTGVEQENGAYRLFTPEGMDSMAPLFMGRGAVEFVDAGSTPPSSGANVSTTRQPLAGAEETLETVLTEEHFARSIHWTGIEVNEIAIDDGTTASVLVITLNEEGQAALQRYSESNRSAFLSLVIDNVAVVSFPIAGALENGTLVIRRLEPQTATAVAAIMRYGPLGLVPEYEIVGQ